jgi:hypothetical protein
MRQPQNAPSGAGELHTHPLSDIAEARELVAGYQPHIMDFRCHDDLASRPLLPLTVKDFAAHAK